ncbi:MAG: hypothetical protein LCH61_20060 [Proteobacteria bacterium]|nr:hypothetical protein [Pseudomonadota bacterium]
MTNTIAPATPVAARADGKHRIETVSVVGLGYVGLPTAALLASRGLNVVGVDVKQEAVDRINSGAAHISEPDLDIVLSAVVRAEKLKAYTTPQPADVFLIAVPTPINADKTADMTLVQSALASIAPVIKKGDLITYANAAVAPGSKLAELRARQDKLVYGA